MSRLWLGLLLLAAAAWADNFALLASFTGGSATLAVGVEMQPDGSRRGELRFATATGVHELRFPAARWGSVAQKIKAAIREARQLPEGQSAEPVEVAGLTVRAVHQPPRPPGVHLSIPETSLVVHDFAGLQGALDGVTGALRTER